MKANEIKKGYSYDEVLIELDLVGLKSKFIIEFEIYQSEEFFKLLKATNKISGPGSLIRLLMKTFEVESINWLFWQKVLVYFMTPDFCRVKNF